MIGATKTSSPVRVFFGTLVGFASWLAVGALGFFVLRNTWAAYALAEPTKAYSLPMLLARLTLGIVCTITAGCIAAIVANGDKRAVWCLGGLLLLISTPVHLIEVWADYPPWYHFAYLLPLLPITLLGGRLAQPRPA